MTSAVRIRLHKHHSPDQHIDIGPAHWRLTANGLALDHAECVKIEITIIATILSTLDTVDALESVVRTNGVKDRSLWRVWIKQLVHIFEQISEGSQHKEQVDSLFLMASQIVSRAGYRSKNFEALPEGHFGKQTRDP